MWHHWRSGRTHKLLVQTGFRTGPAEVVGALMSFSAGDDLRDVIYLRLVIRKFRSRCLRIEGEQLSRHRLIGLTLKLARRYLLVFCWKVSNEVFHHEIIIISLVSNLLKSVFLIDSLDIT